MLFKKKMKKLQVYVEGNINKCFFLSGYKIISFRIFLKMICYKIKGMHLFEGNEAVIGRISEFVLKFGQP